MDGRDDLEAEKKQAGKTYTTPFVATETGREIRAVVGNETLTVEPIKTAQARCH